jgi:hypothetical protein
MSYVCTSRRHQHVVRVQISKTLLVAALIRLDHGGNDYVNHIVKTFPLMFFKVMKI